MAYQSLYRRYRSQTFAEIKGQPHVTNALRLAVAEGRHGHAYLFSGPRGTGKTSTARVLAKALNCEDLSDGEPCGTCKSCTDIEAGRSFDLHELDAASNNKVDDVRDLIAKVSLGSPGRTKVYILDEVHMLTSGAENALLKTLEEPPPHVVFVLATTEPHKVVSTIRSRTQHFEFHLLPGEELADHVRWVIGDAGLDVDEAGIDYALRQGGGSARDTLSALDLVAAAGGVPTTSHVAHDLATAVGEGDPGAALVAIQSALDTGREPRTIGEETLALLRDAFLSAMGAPLGHLNDTSRDEATALASALGAATITRSLEQLGQALVEMRQAPDPRVPLEVALLRLARRDGDDPAALIQRIEQLERQVADLTSGSVRAPAEPATAAPSEDTQAAVTPSPPPVPSPAPSPSTPSAPAPPARGPAAGARQALAETNDASSTPSTQPPQTESAPPPAPTSAPATSAQAATGPRTAGPATGGPPITVDELRQAFDGGLLEALEQRVRARFRLGQFVAVDGDTATFALPNEHVVPRCDEVRPEVEAALAQRFGRPLSITLVVDQSGGQAGARTTPTAERSPASAAPGIGSRQSDETDDIGDINALENATDVTGNSIDRLTEAFPGSTVIQATDD